MSEGGRKSAPLSVQSISHVQLFVTPWTAARQASLSITNSQSLHKLMSIESVMPSSHLILCRPLLLLPPVPPSIRVFSNESTLCIRWPKYWSFSFSISPSREHPGLISFRMDWLDLLAVQGTLKSLLQHHSSKASILQRSAFFMVQEPLCPLQKWPLNKDQSGHWGFPGGTSGKESSSRCRSLRRCGLIPGLGRSPGGGNGNPLQYFCLNNPVDRGAWWATVPGSQKGGHDWAVQLSGH